jgi:hypothetical protein
VTKETQASNDNEDVLSLSDPERVRIRDDQKTTDQFPLAGKEPAEPVELAVQTEVDRSKGKNRLYFTVSERHGYYVEQFRIRFWWKRGGVKNWENAPLVVEQLFDRYLKANETLRLCMEVVPAELVRVGGDIGATGDWDAEVSWHGRVRAANPNPFPPNKDLGSCD